MDWTGGTRRRYTPKGKQSALVQKQKALFARARAVADAQNADSPDLSQQAEASRQYQPPMSSQREYGREREHNHSRRSKLRPDTAASDRSPREYNGSQHRDRHSNHSHTSRKNGPPELRLQRAFPRQQPPSHMTEEERLLYANRERLLARADWLGLSASRPARFRFPSSTDKDKIGKRRKVRKSRTERPKAKEHTPPLPLFGERLGYPKHFMSGAIPQDESMNIRIGTDAFETQTQPSQRTRTPINSSLRQPSTDFGPLSEEPMLVRVDENGFERNDNDSPILSYLGSRPSGTFSSLRHSTHDMDESEQYTAGQSTLPSFAAQSTSYASGSHLPLEESFEDLDAECIPDGSTDGTPMNGHFDDQSQSQENMTINYSTVPESEEDEAEDRTEILLQSSERPNRSKQLPADSDFFSLHATRATTDDLVPVPDQSFWTHGPANPVQRPAPNLEGPRRPTSSTYYFPETFLDQEANVRSPTEPGLSQNFGADYLKTTNFELSTANSLSASERQAQDAHDNEIWRKFVAGSQSSDTVPSQRTRKSKADLWQDTEPVQAAYSTSTTNSDLVRSDRASVGNSRYVGESSDRGSQSGMSEYPTNTSMIAQAATVHPDYDEIDERSSHVVEATEDDEPRSFTTGNIHASSSTTRNRHQGKGLRRPNRFTLVPPYRVSAIRRAKPQNQLQSVYDIQNGD